MKGYIVMAFLFLGVSSQAQQQEVQKTIELFFEAFHQRDTSKLKLVCSDKIILQSISESVTRGNKLEEESVPAFYKSIAGIPTTTKFYEKILRYTIQLDGTMAQVWAPYEFYINDKRSHTGVNSFTLYKDEENWKIVYLIDTRRK
jgi:hypothetical protein